MVSEFFGAGGFGMYPVAAFGSALCASVVLDALRGRSRAITIVLGVLTLCSGLAGTCTGVAGALRAAATARTAVAIGESLHVIVLALVLIMIACVAWIVGRAVGRAPELTAPR
jgi:hypothetical protein